MVAGSEGARPGEGNISGRREAPQGGPRGGSRAPTEEGPDVHGGGLASEGVPRILVVPPAWPKEMPRQPRAGVSGDTPLQHQHDGRSRPRSIDRLQDLVAKKEEMTVRINDCDEVGRPIFQTLPASLLVDSEGSGDVSKT